MNILFETKGLSVHDIYYPDMSMESNKVTFLSGPSGCGKSSLFRMLNNTLTPHEGLALYKNHDIQGLNPLLLRRQVSLVSQEVFLFPGTVQDNFHQFFQYRELPPPEADEIARYSHICCLDADPQADCTHFSGGEKQRLYLAIFLSLHPQVLLLDEPTSSLDYRTSRELMDRLILYTKENDISLIIISHDRELTEKYAEVQINLREGRDPL